MGSAQVLGGVQVAVRRAVGVAYAVGGAGVLLCGLACISDSVGRFGMVLRDAVRVANAICDADVVLHVPADVPQVSGHVRVSGDEALEGFGVVGSFGVVLRELAIISQCFRGIRVVLDILASPFDDVRCHGAHMNVMLLVRQASGQNRVLLDHLFVRSQCPHDARVVGPEVRVLDNLFEDLGMLGEPALVGQVRLAVADLERFPSALVGVGVVSSGRAGTRLRCRFGLADVDRTTYERENERAREESHGSSPLKIDGQLLCVI